MKRGKAGAMGTGLWIGLYQKSSSHQREPSFSVLDWDRIPNDVVLGAFGNIHRV
jgi:hypothetical protein